MTLSVLSQASALNPGSSLWVIPDLEKSHWTAKLDWYLNFQICKSSRHSLKNLPPALSQFLNDSELADKSLPSNPSYPLMIATEELLPNKWTVVIPWENDMTKWREQVFKIWQDLKEPSLRVFLPPGQNAGDLQTPWRNRESFEDFTVVLD